MAKRKIVWSVRARLRLIEILKFYEDRNQSKTYSRKLQSNIYKSLKPHSRLPELGFPTEEEGVRGLIILKYIIYYEYSDTQVFINAVWDCCQNPEDLKIK